MTKNKEDEDLELACSRGPRINSLLRQNPFSPCDSHFGRGPLELFYVVTLDL